MFIFCTYRGPLTRLFKVITLIECFVFVPPQHTKHLLWALNKAFMCVCLCVVGLHFCGSAYNYSANCFILNDKHLLYDHLSTKASFSCCDPKIRHAQTSQIHRLLFLLT